MSLGERNVIHYQLCKWHSIINSELGGTKNGQSKQIPHTQW